MCIAPFKTVISISLVDGLKMDTFINDFLFYMQAEYLATTSISVSSSSEVKEAPEAEQTCKRIFFYLSFHFHLERPYTFSNYPVKSITEKNSFVYFFYGPAWLVFKKEYISVYSSWNIPQFPNISFKCVIVINDMPLVAFQLPVCCAFVIIMLWIKFGGSCKQSQQRDCEKMTILSNKLYTVNYTTALKRSTVDT